MVGNRTLTAMPCSSINSMRRIRVVDASVHLRVEVDVEAAVGTETARGAERADRPLHVRRMAVEEHLLGSVVVADPLPVLDRGTREEPLGPHVERLEHVPVGIDDRQLHWSPLLDQAVARKESATLWSQMPW